MCDPLTATAVGVAIVAVGSGGYSAYEQRQQRKEAQDQADQQAEDAKKARRAQELLNDSRNDNKKYSKPADVQFGTVGNTDATTSFNGLDAFRINPTPSAPGALNIPGGTA